MQFTLVTQDATLAFVPHPIQVLPLDQFNVQVPLASVKYNVFEIGNRQPVIHTYVLATVIVTPAFALTVMLGPLNRPSWDCSQ
jgi:hypothetical protein